MNIGVPREIKTREGRVALTPVGVKTLVQHGHKVSIEKSAGAGSGIQDATYEEAGACLVDSADKLWAAADIIVKVKEPIEEEIFYTLKEAKTLIEKWRMEYNTFRPHSSLNYRSPAPEAYLN